MVFLPFFFIDDVQLEKIRFSNVFQKQNIKVKLVMQRHSLEIAFEYKSEVSYATSFIRNDLISKELFNFF
jgi:hypothetical protein